MERRRAILEAAEALLGEKGYEAATLKAIGERAGIPIASVYHYFSDRYQVEAELMRRHAQGLDACIGYALGGPGPRTLHEAADAVIDPLLGYFRRHPSSIELWFSGRSAPVVELVRAFDAAQAERLWRLLVERGLLRPDTPRLALQLAFEVGNRLFDIAFRDSAAGDDATIAEARRLITAYLTTYAPDGA
ncbi:TetR family transcriptional regulator [Streptomyces chrestomyceticus JCM 4735]|uniref:TetR family transcriptional regulator n=1 Tax=Streptomyces chrestomyceticus JCM 4735 TaxID=1306181 RepID=A0A7U9KQV2_9ACTN|nr:TetR/AcrR family transcriptional regulator [Streptomyces chrestomyceticus]GCD33136.1 TetR family transcriptional regulator [Streptomyces chrestomyceticus JCM 4735]